MTRSFSLPFLAVLLVLTAQQENSTPAQSVADAARAARERQKSSTPKHMLTDDDLAARHGSAESDALAGTEAQVRTRLENSYPPIPSAADLKSQIDQMTTDSKTPAVQLTAKYKQAALYGYETVDFPGRQEWEDQLESATARFVEEAATGATAVQATLDKNREAFDKRDDQAIQKVRSEWIATVVPYASWQLRTQQLIVEGRSRAKAYVADSATALREYRRAHVPQAESAIGSTMMALQGAEIEFRQSHDHYSCELAELQFDVASSAKRQNSQADWTSRLNAIHNLGYELQLQGCDADHFTALATPPAPDGTQGHAFCSSETVLAHIAEDGRTANCLTTGREWHGK